MDPAMKSAFGLNNKADDKTIQKQLILKKISYGSLNGALVPDQDKDKFETCFVFNSEQMDSFASGKQRSRQISSRCWNDGCCNHYIAFIVGLQNSKKWIS